MSTTVEVTRTDFHYFFGNCFSPGTESVYVKLIMTTTLSATTATPPNFGRKIVVAIKAPGNICFMQISLRGKEQLSGLWDQITPTLTTRYIPLQPSACH